MKAYTNINQSKELAEILPKKSADMFYTGACFLIARPFVDGYTEIKEFIDEGAEIELPTPAWSLSALLDIINENYYTTLFHDGVAWNIDVMHHDDDNIKHNCHANTPIDACVEMIIKLHKEKLL